MQILSHAKFPKEKKSLGGKALGLLDLARHNVRIPSFYILFDFGDYTNLNRQDLEIVLAGWLSDEKIDPHQTWAIRSSAANEDGVEKSFAGQYTTVLDVSFVELGDAIKAVFDSFQKTSAYSDKAEEFTILIQEMLNVTYSGVFFTKDPIQIYKNDPLITIIPGIGDPLVSGELTGLSFTFKNDLLQVLGDDDVIEGQELEGGKRIKIERSKVELEKSLIVHLSEMLRVASVFEKKFNLALDFEFAIQNNQLYWLQMRPITTRALKESFEVWDNTSVEANFEGLTQPLTISFIAKTFAKAYGGGAKNLGFSRSVLAAYQTEINQMSGGINGALYYNVTAWQALLYQMPGGKKLSQKLPQIWGMADATYSPKKGGHSIIRKIRIALNLGRKLLLERKESKRYHMMYEKTVDAYRNGNYTQGDFVTLKKKYSELESELGDNWLAPVLNGFYTTLIFSLFKKTVANSKVTSTHPNFANDVLFSDDEVISLKLVRCFQDLLVEIDKDIELKKLVAETDASALDLKLKDEFPTFYRRINTYVDAYGNRVEEGELKMETITYKDDRMKFMRYLKANALAYIPRQKQENKFDRHQVLKQHYPFHFLKRGLILFLAKKTVKRIKARENYRFMRTETFAIVRAIFLAMGKDLEAKQIVDDCRAIFYLNLEEVIDGNTDAFRQIIAERKDEYKAYANTERVNRYIALRNEFVPVSEDDHSLNEKTLKGIGCCSGIVKGEVVVIDEHTDLEQDFNGKILIAHFFHPGWIGIFNQAIGIISERGNLLSHTAIICRELNLPSIVGAKGLMKTIVSGQVIRMNGGTGHLEIIEKEDV